MKNLRVLPLLIISVSFTLVACSQEKFSSARSAVLRKSIFGNETDQASGSITQPGNGNDASGAEVSGSVGQPPSGNAGGSVAQPTTTTVPVLFICSTSEATLYVGTSVSSAAAVELKISDPGGNVVCDQTAGVKEYITKNKAIDLSACNLTGNSYTAKLIDPAKPAQDLFYADIPSRSIFAQDDYISLTRTNPTLPWTALSHVSSTQDGMSSSALTGLFSSDTSVSVLWAANAAYKKPLSGAVDNSACDSTASPLVINMTATGQPDPGVSLSSPANGVWFDILGRNAHSYAHAKQRISWIRNPNYMLVALPVHGNVNGIDELFGNNTYGPDYAFADNGFQALAKYDNNYDDVINAKDPVYSALRLWSDSNFDGIAQREELKSLEELGIVEIDLVYDPSYFEQDQYGNQSRMRSTVQTLDGVLHMIFDLWFALN
jgi:hypothetical protein